jgi:hypothetical protein
LSSEVSVTVSTPYGVADPANGVVKLNKGDIKTFKVTSPWTENKKVWGIPWEKIWTCTGWSGTGSTPPKGVGTSATFPVTEDSTITWNWQGGQLGTQILSIVTIILLIAFVVVFTKVWPHAFMVALLAGALGGLGHEMVQSQGTFILPNTDETGNFCLGGLIGIIIGGTAGLTTYQGLLGGSKEPTATTALIAAAILAGLAVKGIADSANPPTASTSTTK